MDDPAIPAADPRRHGPDPPVHRQGRRRQDERRRRDRAPLRRARLPHDRPLDRHRPQPRRRVRRPARARSRPRSRPNLWGQEPDVYFNIARYWRTIQDYVAELFAWHGLDEVLAEEMTVLPGMDELGNLLWIADHVDQGKFDVIVVDAAPTGETLRLLSLPEASRWWVERIAPIGRRVSRLGGPVIQRMIGVPMPKEEVFKAAERLLRRLDQLHKLLADPDAHIGPDRPGPREDVDRRGAALVHLLPPVRLPERPGRGEPGPAATTRAATSPACARRSSGTCRSSSRSSGRCRSGRCPMFDREMVGIERLREAGQRAVRRWRSGRGPLPRAALRGAQGRRGLRR